MEATRGTNKIIVILLIVTIVIVIGLAGFFGYFIFFKKDNPSTNARPKKVVEQTVELKEFTINLADESTSYIKTTLVIGFEDKKLAAEITEKMPMIRDAINEKLWSKKSEDFKGNGLDKVKKELLDSVNSVLSKGKITNVYVQQIIIQ